MIKSHSLQQAPNVPTILVVEDDELVRLLAVEFLQESGFKVVDADSAARAVSLLEADRHIDAVFSDIQMPGDMDGLELARWISREMPDVKVLLTSGKVPDQPGRPVLAKPYQLESLARRLKDMVEH